MKKIHLNEVCIFCYKEINYLATICPYCQSKNPVKKPEKSYTQEDVRRAKKLGISLDELDQIKTRELLENYQDPEIVSSKQVIYFFIMCAMFYLHSQIFDHNNITTGSMIFSFVVPAIIIYYLIVINDWLNNFLK